MPLEGSSLFRGRGTQPTLLPGLLQPQAKLSQGPKPTGKAGPSSWAPPAGRAGEASRLSGGSDPQPTSDRYRPGLRLGPLPVFSLNPHCSSYKPPGGAPRVLQPAEWGASSDLLGGAGCKRLEEGQATGDLHPGCWDHRELSDGQVLSLG